MYGNFPYGNTPYGDADVTFLQHIMKYVHTFKVYVMNKVTFKDVGRYT